MYQHNPTRQHILSDLDEVISQIILQADRIERLDVTVPDSVVKEIARRLISVAFKISFYAERPGQPGITTNDCERVLLRSQ
jgi:hypothetical protein